MRQTEMMNLKQKIFFLLAITTLALSAQAKTKQPTETASISLTTASYDEALAMNTEQLCDHFREISNNVLNFLKNNAGKKIELTFLTELHATTITIKKSHINLVKDLITECIHKETTNIALAFMNSKTMLSVALNVAQAIGAYWSAQLARALIPIWFNMKVIDPKTGLPSSHPDRYQEYKPTVTDAHRN
jgi:hypothetical protein